MVEPHAYPDGTGQVADNVRFGGGYPALLDGDRTGEVELVQAGRYGQYRGADDTVEIIVGDYPGKGDLRSHISNKAVIGHS